VNGPLSWTTTLIVKSEAGKGDMQRGIQQMKQRNFVLPFFLSEKLRISRLKAAN